MREAPLIDVGGASFIEGMFINQKNHLVTQMIKWYLLTEVKNEKTSSIAHFD